MSDCATVSCSSADSWPRAPSSARDEARRASSKHSGARSLGRAGGAVPRRHRPCGPVTCNASRVCAKRAKLGHRSTAGSPPPSSRRPVADGIVQPPQRVRAQSNRNVRANRPATSAAATLISSAIGVPASSTIHTGVLIRCSAWQREVGDRERAEACGQGTRPHDEGQAAGTRRRMRLTCRSPRGRSATRTPVVVQSAPALAVNRLGPDQRTLGLGVRREPRGRRARAIGAEATTQPHARPRTARRRFRRLAAGPSTAGEAGKALCRLAQNAQRGGSVRADVTERSSRALGRLRPAQTARVARTSPARRPTTTTRLC